MDVGQAEISGEQSVPLCNLLGRKWQCDLGGFAFDCERLVKYYSTKPASGGSRQRYT